MTKDVKALVVIKKEEYEKIRGWENNCSHPLLTPVCNKPLLEYWIEFVTTCGINEVCIVSDSKTEVLEEWSGDGNRWGIHITFGQIQNSDSIEDILDKKQGPHNGSKWLIIRGLFFLHFDFTENYSAILKKRSRGTLATCETGSLSIHNTTYEKLQSEKQKNKFHVTAIKSLGDIHVLNTDIINSRTGKYVLPGYSSSGKINVGENVMIDDDVKIIPPVIIGDYAKIHGQAVIGPSTVIGNNVIVDFSTRVAESVIMDNTYIGKHLDFNKKIVWGNRIASGGSSSVSIDDPKLFCKT